MSKKKITPNGTENVITKPSPMAKRKITKKEMDLEKELKIIKDTIESRHGRPLIRTMFNAKFLPKYYEVNTQPSLTIPDQTLTVRQIMEKHRRGLPVDIALHGEYFGDEPQPDMRRLDLSEQHDLLEAAKQKVRETQKAIDKHKWNAQVEKSAILRQKQIEKQNAENKVSEPPIEKPKAPPSIS